MGDLIHVILFTRAVLPKPWRYTPYNFLDAVTYIRLTFLGSLVNSAQTNLRVRPKKIVATSLCSSASVTNWDMKHSKTHAVSSSLGKVPVLPGAACALEIQNETGGLFWTFSPTVTSCPWASPRLRMTVPYARGEASQNTWSSSVCTSDHFTLGKNCLGAEELFNLSTSDNKVIMSLPLSVKQNPNLTGKPINSEKRS